MPNCYQFQLKKVFSFVWCKPRASMSPLPITELLYRTILLLISSSSTTIAHRLRGPPSLSWSSTATIAVLCGGWHSRKTREHRTFEKVVVGLVRLITMIIAKLDGDNNMAPLDYTTRTTTTI